jgi:hypothetical protein
MHIQSDKEWWQNLVVALMGVGASMFFVGVIPALIVLGCIFGMGIVQQLIQFIAS